MSDRLIDADKLRKDVLDLPNCPDGYSDTYDKALIIALVEDQPIIDVESLNAKHEDIGYEKGFRDGYAEALEVTDDAEKYGHWISHHEPYTWMGYTYWSCSECGFECGYDKDILHTTNYCPNCGAKNII